MRHVTYQWRMINGRGESNPYQLNECIHRYLYMNQQKYLCVGELFLQEPQVGFDSNACLQYRSVFLYFQPTMEKLYLVAVVVLLVYHANSTSITDSFDKDEKSCKHGGNDRL